MFFSLFFSLRGVVGASGNDHAVPACGPDAHRLPAGRRLRSHYRYELIIGFSIRLYERPGIPVSTLEGSRPNHSRDESGVFNPTVIDLSQ